MKGFNSLRHLRTFLGKEQREMAVIAGCSRHTVESIEQGRLKLSPRLATEIAEATAIDSSWLLANDQSLPMVTRAGAAYSVKAFELAQDAELSKPLPLYQFPPEMKVNVATDLLHQALRAARRCNAVQPFLRRLENFIRSEIRRFPELANEVRTERQHETTIRKWQHETTIRKRQFVTKNRGKWQHVTKNKFQARELLFPRDAGPLQRNKRRCLEAIAEFRAWEKVSKK
jgi:transcriptional regulator with XRE-family HTH domain